MENFFGLDTYIVDQEIWSFGSKYKVQDAKGTDIGRIVEDKSKWQTISQYVLRYLLKVKAQKLPFHLRIEDNNQNPILIVRKNIGNYISSIEIIDANNNLIASIQKKITLLVATFEVLDQNNNLVAIIKGEDFDKHDFVVLSPEKKILARIEKKYNSILTELFTSADKYKISLKPWLTEENLRKIVIASSIVIDKIYKEAK